MNNLNMMLARHVLTSEEGQQLITDQLSSVAKLATDPEVIQGAIKIAAGYIKALTEGLKAISPEDRQAIVGAVTGLITEIQKYIDECEQLGEAAQDDFEKQEAA